jgi:hypothetical protein
MVGGPCCRCARPVVARVALGRGCRRGVLDNVERGRAISAEGVCYPTQFDWDCRVELHRVMTTVVSVRYS